MSELKCAGKEEMNRTRHLNLRREFFAPAPRKRRGPFYKTAPALLWRTSSVRAESEIIRCAVTSQTFSRKQRHISNGWSEVVFAA